MPEEEEAMKKKYAAFALLLLVPAFAISQSSPAATTADSEDAALAAPVPVDQQPSKEDLSKLFEVMHLREQMQKQLQTMRLLIQQQLQQQEKLMSAQNETKLTPDQQAGLDKVLQKYIGKAMNMFSVDEIIAGMIPIYQRHFTKDDVNSLIAFYSTPAGQHMIALQPVIMKEYMPVMMKRVQERSAQLTAGLINDMSTYLKTYLKIFPPPSETDSQ
jgi:uncharacterized protein